MVPLLFRVVTSGVGRSTMPSRVSPLDIRGMPSSMSIGSMLRYISSTSFARRKLS